MRPQTMIPQDGVTDFLNRTRVDHPDYDRTNDVSSRVDRGDIVEIYSAPNGRIAVRKALAGTYDTILAAVESPGEYPSGVAVLAGFVLLTGQDTSAGAQGDPVYLSASTAGAWEIGQTTGDEPMVGKILEVHATAGVVLLCPGKVMIPQAGAPAPLRKATGTLTAAQVIALNATPITVIPAPGAGKFVRVEYCHWFLDFASAAYDGAAAGETLDLRYTNGAGAAVVDAVAGNAIGAAAADYHTLVRAVPEVIPVANAPIVASIASGSWFAAAGDSPIKFEIGYQVLNLTPS